MIKKNKGGENMPNSQTKATAKWKAKAMRRIHVDVRREYFDDVLSKAIEDSGLSMQGYVRQAIIEKTSRDGYGTPTDKYHP